MKKLLLGSLIYLTAACGGGTGSPNLVSNFAFEYKDGDAILDIGFSQDFSLNLEVTKTIKDYGAISFIPGIGDRGFTIRALLSAKAWVDGVLTINKTNRLPNGSPFPSYIGTQLSTFEFVNEPKFSGLLYLGTEPQKKYIGTTVAMNFVSQNFPSGLAVSQRLLNNKGEIVGVATAYGPLLDKNGNVVQPGGLFAAANLSTIFPGVGVVPANQAGKMEIHTDGSLEISAPAGVKVSDEQALDFLLKFKKEGKRAGMFK
jgi:hypothetical protein